MIISDYFKKPRVLHILKKCNRLLGILNVSNYDFVSLRDTLLKLLIFREGHKILQNLPLTFAYSTYSQKLGEDFEKICGLLRMYEL